MFAVIGLTGSIRCDVVSEMKQGLIDEASG
jgi:hypothetical protein